MPSDGPNESACPGCGLLLPESAGPSHPYIGASPACWERFGELLAREYGEFQYPDIHRLTVDAYAVQHPGVPGRRSINSVCVHLIALHLQLERGMEPTQVTKAMDGISRGLELRWLDPPDPNGSIRVTDVLAAEDLDAHVRLVRAWADDVWAAWSAHHETVRAWAQQALGG